MKNPSFAKRFLFAAGLAALSQLNIFAQGALTPPPGPPAPTMKTLDQIEARTPLGIPNAATSAMITITNAGSYVLVGPVTVAAGNAIQIQTNGVTLDLNGFTIRSTEESGGTAILIDPGLERIVIRNGFIESGSTFDSATTNFTARGFFYGIFGEDVNATVENVSVTGTSVGILLGSTTGPSIRGASMVSNCQALRCVFTGISADLVSNSSVKNSGGGINASHVSGCYADVIKGAGIYGRVVNNSTGLTKHGRFSQFGAGIGIYGQSISNCYGSSESQNGVGIYAEEGTVSFSYGYGLAPGFAIKAATVIGCSAFGPVSSPNKLLGTP